MKPTLLLEQPHEGWPVHHGEARVAQRHEVVLARLVLQDRALAEPAAGPAAGKCHGLAVSEMALIFMRPLTTPVQ